MNKPKNKAQRLAMYRRTLKVLKKFVANGCQETETIIHANQHKTYNITMSDDLGLCFIMSFCGFDRAYSSLSYKQNVPELFKVGRKHKCNFKDASWFRFEGGVYPLHTHSDNAINYQKRIEFMEQVIKETLK